MTDTHSTTSRVAVPTSPSRRPYRWWVRRLGFTLLAIPLTYGLIVLIGLFPVNQRFQPTEDGIEIRIISTSVHADVIVPLVSDEFDWRELFPHGLFMGNTSHATHLAIGWGDRGFFLETPTWADLTFATATRALLWPTDSCLHVTMTRMEYWRDEGRSVRISDQQYRELVKFIHRDIKFDGDGRIVAISGVRYGHDDLFIEARGRYHALNTCNSWVGRAMRQAGIRVPWLTPLPRTMFLWLSEN